MTRAAILPVVLALSLPFIALHDAFVVKLQVPRVLWMLELLLTAYVVWWLIERPAQALSDSRVPLRRLVVVGALVLLSSVRGAYVTFVEHASRPAVRLDLAAMNAESTSLLIGPFTGWAN